MRQTILTVACLSLLAALCEQLLGKSRYYGVIRLTIGLEIVLAVLAMLDGVSKWMS